jgi:hypothetical protein
MVDGEPDQHPNTMTTWDVAVLVGYTSDDRRMILRQAAGWLHRAGIGAVGRQPGRTGMNLYPTDAVRAALDAMPGRGAPGQPRAKRHQG